MLGAVRVELDLELAMIDSKSHLVHSRDDLPLLLQVFEHQDAEVADTNRLDLALGKHGLHLLPCLGLRPLKVHVAAPVRLEGEHPARLIGDHPRAPVDEVQVEVVRLERGQGLVEALLDAVVERAPDLGGEEDVLAVDTGVFDALSDLVLVLLLSSMLASGRDLHLRRRQEPHQCACTPTSTHARPHLAPLPAWPAMSRGRWRGWWRQC